MFGGLTTVLARSTVVAFLSPSLLTSIVPGLYGSIDSGSKLSAQTHKRSVPAGHQQVKENQARPPASATQSTAGGKKGRGTYI